MLFAHTPDELKEALECLNSVYRVLRVVVNTHKTEVMFEWSCERPRVDPVMKSDEAELRTVTQFTYLGGILYTDRTADSKINQRINNVSASFPQIRKRVVTNHQ